VGIIIGLPFLISYNSKYDDYIQFFGDVLSTLYPIILPSILNYYSQISKSSLADS